MKRYVIRRFSPVGVLMSCYLGVSTLLRLVLFARFGPQAEVSWLTLAPVLLAGTINDAVESLYLFLPLVLIVSLSPDSWHRTRAGRASMLAATLLIVGSLVFLAAVEMYFFEEFDARFNVVAFDYLIYPTEVFGGIRREYPVGSVLVGATVVAVLVVGALRQHLLRGFDVRVRVRSRMPVLVTYCALLGAAISMYPTDALSISSNRITNELIQNGHSSFFRAARTNEIDYRAYYLSRPSDSNVRMLAKALQRGGGRFVALEEGRLDREFPARADGLGRLNVVVISMESFGAEFSALYGSGRNLTPELDAFARQGLWFSNAYASGTRTVRGLEALTTSLPPIPTVSILRRPGSEHISNWGTVMKKLGYHTSFLYGGYGYFDNMSHFYASNDFEVIDRASIERARFQNIWGVSDEDLFDRALGHFDALHARGEPFFSIVMTTSNHKPFTFRPGLDALGIPPTGGGRAAGVRYADYALGRFLREANGHPWFDDTLFVVVADHGARVYGREDIPLRTYEIPLVMYAPAHVAPRRVDTLIGQIDVAPTVMGLLGLGYRAPFFGQDVLSHPEAAHVAFFNHNHDVALMRDGKLVVLGLNHQVAFRTYDKRTDRYAVAASDGALRDLAVSYYQTAFELFTDRKL
jgi:phosphoglycerol transferase MdoB-like AlkP superfamily enzyme